ncbi:transcriptional regulator [Brachybacterium halotolerans subsp. kimchii]|uniref:glycine cleavage system protein R n=1 Tax=Brachybacterium halotolerans TaxID=2795215 RepID=UPI001E582F8E|nr:ACT domain-containing protein [Brachybacterium halotolerans]UEJ82953.1 transcriptional regulator [Brachybacterium halotolerans subsp. kimchii]
MTQLVLTAIGEDREGLVSALARVVETQGGNWLDSQFARLAGTFAGIVLVEIDESRATSLEAAVADLLSEVGWSIEVTRAPEHEAADAAGAAGGGAAAGAAGSVAASALRVHLLGQDRSGMVHQVSRALAEQGVSIESFRSWTLDAPEGGGVLFEAEALVRLPATGIGGADADVVRRVLEPIANDLMVDLDLEDAAPATGA